MSDNRKEGETVGRKKAETSPDGKVVYLQTAKQPEEQQTEKEQKKKAQQQAAVIFKEAQYRQMAVNALLPADYNPRKDLQPGDRAFDALARSIDKYGMLQPIVWNEVTGHVVGGHQRLKVIKAKGIAEIIVAVVHMTEQEEKAANLAMNRIGGSFEDKLLKSVFEELRDSDVDIIDTGFTAKEVDDFMASMAALDSDLLDDDNGDTEEQAPKLITCPGCKNKFVGSENLAE